MDAGLLASTNTNDSSAEGIRNTVGLCVLESKGSNYEVGEGLRR